MSGAERARVQGLPTEMCRKDSINHDMNYTGESVQQYGKQKLCKLLSGLEFVTVSARGVGVRSPLASLCHDPSTAGECPHSHGSPYDPVS